MTQLVTGTAWSYLADWGGAGYQLCGGLTHYL